MGLVTLITQHATKPQSQSRNGPWTRSRFVEYSAIPHAASRMRRKLTEAKSVTDSDMQKYPGSVLEASDISGPLSSENTVFYTHVLCPFAERVWLTLLEKRVKHDLVHVDLSCKPSWYRGLNPRGLVPCVVYQDEVIIESEDICRWIDAKHDGPALMPPSGSLSSELAEQAMRLSPAISSACLSVISAGKHAAWSVGTNASQDQLNAFRVVCEDLGHISQQSGGPFLLGPEPGLPDMMAWPFIHRALFCSKHFSGYDALAADSGVSKYAREWILAMQSLASAQVALPNPDLLRHVLERTGRIDWFDYETAGVDRLHPNLVPVAEPR